MTDRVKSLEAEVASLDPAELRRFASWFAAYQDNIWEGRIAADAAEGRLDFLVSEAKAQQASGKLHEL